MIKKFKLSDGLKPYARFLLPENFNLPMEVEKLNHGEIYLPTNYVFRHQGIIFYKYFLVGKASNYIFPYHSKELFDYRSIPGKCRDMYCGRSQEILKSWTKSYKKIKKD